MLLSCDSSADGDEGLSVAAATVTAEDEAASLRLHRPVQPACSKTVQLLERRRKVAAAAAAALNCQSDRGEMRRRDRGGTDGSIPQLRCLWAGWVFMCWASGMMAAAGFLLPYWLKGSRDVAGGADARRHLSDLGLFRLCAYPTLGEDGLVRLVMDCGHYRHFAEIPSPMWRAAFVLMAAACCLMLLLTFFLAFSGFRLAVLRIPLVVAVCGITQASSSAFVLLSCVLYPAGWSDNPDVAQVCGSDADAFRLGHCQLGWAYVLVCASGFLGAATVAFPAQISRHFLEGSLYAAAVAAEDWREDEAEQLLVGDCSSSNSGRRQACTRAVEQQRYRQVVYHSLRRAPCTRDRSSSRPASVCTWASSDCGSAVAAV